MANKEFVNFPNASRLKKFPQRPITCPIKSPNIPISVIGARLYYVVFAWSEFKDNPLLILNLRTGGLAIYGGVLPNP